MCGHRLATGSDVSVNIEPGAHDSYEESVTLSFVSDRSSPSEVESYEGRIPDTGAADPVCEICGIAVTDGGVLCKACAHLTASSERDDG
jgi:hypothetical protein